jgi:hypothetical protein
MWVEVTFVLSMLEPWEKILLSTYFLFYLSIFPNLVHTVVFFATSNLALLVCIFIYFPAHLVYLRERTIYYLCGTNSAVLPDCTMSLLYE